MKTRTETLLLIDSGNSRVKWALASMPASASFLIRGVCPQAQREALVAQWAGIESALRPQKILVANVAGAAVETALLTLLAQAGFDAIPSAFFKSVSACAGVTNGYLAPEQLGCDRMAALIAARTLFPSQPLLVVSSGTATTVDALRADGHFSGGMILPGLASMAAALAQGTAQLPALSELHGAQPGARPTGLSNRSAFASFSPFANQTHDGIINGCLTAHCATLRFARQNWEQACGAPVRGILSGGAAGSLAAWLEPEFACIEDLVLRGLQICLSGPG